MNFSVPLNLNLNNLFQHWWTLCRRESLDSLSRANLDLLACSLHLNQSQLCSAWSSQIIAGIGRVIRRLQSFQARERSVPARGRVPGTSAACPPTERFPRRAWKDREVPARVITRWRESGSGAEVQARAGKRGNSEARTPVAQENNNSLSANINSPDSLFPRCWKHLPGATLTSLYLKKFLTVTIASQGNPCRVKYIYQLLRWAVPLFLAPLL